jgi:hypothetical protein
VDVHLAGKRFADDEEVQTEVWKGLRQQSKYFIAAGFDALIKQWDNYTNIGRGYIEKLTFFSDSNITFFFLLFISICDLFTDSPQYVGYKALEAVIMNGFIFWYITPCSPLKFTRFGVTYCLHLQVRGTIKARKQYEAGSKQSTAFTCYHLHVGFLLGVFFYLEYGGDLFNIHNS